MTFHPRLLVGWLCGPCEPSGRVTKRSEAAHPLQRVRLSLEELEQRVVLSTTVVTPPSFQQAALALYIDGYRLGFAQFSQLANQNLQPNIAFYTPYAQPLSLMLVLAGARAGTAAINQFTSTYGSGAIDLLP